MRHPVTILLFVVCVAATATAMGASGTAGWLGADIHTGVQDDVKQSESKMKDYKATRGSGDTSFIGATLAGVDKVIQSFVVVFVLAAMLQNLGVPGWAALMVSSPLVWSFGLFILYMLTGRAEVRPR